MRPPARASVVLALAALWLAASKVIELPRRDAGYLGPGPPSAGDVAWTSWALCGVVVVACALWWLSRRPR